MYEIELGNARVAAMRNSVPDDIARYVHAEYREHDAEWLLVKKSQKQ